MILGPWWLEASLALLSVAVPARGDGPEATVPMPYAVAHDEPLEPTEAVVAEADDHVQLRVEFNGINRDRVPAFLYLPRERREKLPAVLLQYGTGGNKSTNYIVAIGRQFVAHGFAVLTIDAPLRGERAPKEKKKVYWINSDSGRDNFLQYLGDYSRAVDYLVARPDVDPQRVGYVGISWGAITGLTFVAHDPRIKAMASMAGGGNFLGILPGELPERMQSVWSQVDPVFHVKQIAPRPLLLLNVTRDQLIPRFFAESLHKAAGEGARVVWLETDHHFNGIDRAEVAESVITFMEENLPAD